MTIVSLNALTPAEIRHLGVNVQMALQAERHRLAKHHLRRWQPLRPHGFRRLNGQRQPAVA